MRMCVPGRGEAGPEGISFGLGAAERGWCGPRAGTSGREQAQGVGRGQIEGSRGHRQASGFILRKRRSYRAKCAHWYSVSP